VNNECVVSWIWSMAVGLLILSHNHCVVSYIFTKRKTGPMEKNPGRNLGYSFIDSTFAL
jgi:hypothetical protein